MKTRENIIHKVRHGMTAVDRPAHALTQPVGLLPVDQCMLAVLFFNVVVTLSLR